MTTEKHEIKINIEIPAKPDRKGTDTESSPKKRTDNEDSNVAEINSDELALPKSQQNFQEKIWRRICQFYVNNALLILVTVAILLAYPYPPLGAVYLYPRITSTIAIFIIFVMVGIGLKTSEFSKAFQRIYFNSFVQLHNFFIVSSIVYGISRALISLKILDRYLADGMTICACLPQTPNSVIIFTKSGRGDEAAAAFNSAFSNVIGVFLTPLLILAYLGIEGDVSTSDVLLKLFIRVILPIGIGQLVQKISKGTVAFVSKHRFFFKSLQEFCLAFIVYTVFCKTFMAESYASVEQVFLMIGLQFLLLSSVMFLAWFLLKLFFRDKPRLRVMGLFGCTFKTMAMGIPLINALYEESTNMGSYTLPLLVWHPMQLVIGSALVPKLSNFVEREEERIEGR